MARNHEAKNEPTIEATYSTAEVKETIATASEWAEAKMNPPCPISVPTAKELNAVKKAMAHLVNVLKENNLMLAIDRNIDNYDPIIVKKGVAIISSALDVDKEKAPLCKSLSEYIRETDQLHDNPMGTLKDSPIVYYDSYHDDVLMNMKH